MFAFRQRLIGGHVCRYSLSQRHVTQAPVPKIMTLLWVSRNIYDIHKHTHTHIGIRQGFPGGSVDKESACSGENLGSIPGLGRSPGEGNGKLLQYSRLGHSRGAWQAPVHGVTRVRHGLVTKPSAMPYMIYLIQIIYAIQMIINDTHMHVLFFGPT